MDKFIRKWKRDSDQTKHCGITTSSDISDDQSKLGETSESGQAKCSEVASDITDDHQAKPSETSVSGQTQRSEITRLTVTDDQAKPSETSESGQIKPSEETVDASEQESQSVVIKHKLNESDQRPGPPAKKKRASRQYRKEWENTYPWLTYDEPKGGAICKVCSKWSNNIPIGRSGGVWATKGFSNWKKALEKLKEHNEAGVHKEALVLDRHAKQSDSAGTVQELAAGVTKGQRDKNRDIIKDLLRITYFLCKNHIPHTANFAKLIELVVECGGENLKNFLRSAPGNATYTSKKAVSEFVDAIGEWLLDSLLDRLTKAELHTLMSDECTDVSIIEELTICFRWVENGVPEEHFLDVIPIKSAKAKDITSAFITYYSDKSIDIQKIVGLGFDGCATFSGRKAGVQAQLKEHSPHAVYIHCHNHVLQLACVQAANSTLPVKHVYSTLVALWKYYHYSPKRATSLREVQAALELPELKVAKPSDTRWLSHEKSVSIVKSQYPAILSALENQAAANGDCDAQGLLKNLKKPDTIMCIYMLSEVLPICARLSTGLQSKTMNFLKLKPIVDATVSAIKSAAADDAKWLNEFQNDRVALGEQTNKPVTDEQVGKFRNKVVPEFVSNVVSSIEARFEKTAELVGAFAIFDPQHIPDESSDEYSKYGESQLDYLASNFGTERSCKTLAGEVTVRPSLIDTEDSNIHNEWTVYKRYLVSQQGIDLTSICQELVTSDMLVKMYPCLSKLALICLTLPVGTASAERSFSAMKLVKTRLRSRLNEESLSNLMRIAIEGPEKLTDENLNDIIKVWAKKPRNLSV